MEDRVAALLREGQAAAHAGQRDRARRKFQDALALDSTNTDALLWLAWLSDDPRASLAYVARALACDPHNPRARAALRWAHRRVVAPEPAESPPPSTPATLEPRHRWGRTAVAVALGLLIVLVGSALAWSLPTDTPVSAAFAPTSSPTTIATASSTPTPTHTPTPTSTPTPTTTLTPPPTETPTPVLRADPQDKAHIPTVTPRPALPTAPPFPPTATLAPLSINSNMRWIDINLTHQRLTAYEGKTLVRTTLVSTGLPRTPTPVGQYHIWLKLRYDDMSGPGYYLANVPYVMYFYGGYGLHGTYWHSNFGHPISHGCVNMPTSEAEWLFNWVEVGTMVNVHY